MTTKKKNKELLRHFGRDEHTGQPIAVSKWRPRMERIPFDEQVGMAREMLAHPERYSPVSIERLQKKVAKLTPEQRRKYGLEESAGAD